MREMRPVIYWLPPIPRSAAKSRVNIAHHPPAVARVLSKMGGEEDEPNCLIHLTRAHVQNGRLFWVE